MTVNKTWQMPFVILGFITIFFLGLFIIDRAIGILGFLDSDDQSGYECEKCYAHSVLPFIGKWNLSNFSHTAKKTCAAAKSACYEVTYEYDEYGRRMTANNNLKSKNHLLLFGDSVAFGEGHEGDKTLAAQLAAKTKAKVYNYAISGGGAGTALTLLDSRKVAREVPEKSGSALFIAAPYQQDWTTFSTKYPWAWSFPKYDFDKKGEITYVGLFSESSPKATARLESAQWYMKHFNFLKLINFEYPYFQDHEKAKKLYLGILQKLASSYESQFDGKFFVVAHPYASDDTFRDDLAQAGLRVVSPGVDFASLEPENRYICECEELPSSSQNPLIAEQIARSLEDTERAQP